MASSMQEMHGNGRICQFRALPDRHRVIFHVYYYFAFLFHFLFLAKSKINQIPRFQGCFDWYRHYGDASNRISKDHRLHRSIVCFRREHLGLPTASCMTRGRSSHTCRLPPFITNIFNTRREISLYFADALSLFPSNPTVTTRAHSCQAR